MAISVFVFFALTPAFAVAQSPGALTQLASPNNCIKSTTSESTECTTTATGISGNVDEPLANVAVSRDGSNVYVLSQSDDAIAEFSRNADGSLTQIGCIVDTNGSDGSTCTSDTTVPYLLAPRGIAISPDGNNVYVAAEDDDENGAIAEFSRSSDGTLTGIGCVAESAGSSPCSDDNGAGISDPVALVATNQNVYVASESDQAVSAFTRGGDGTLTELGCIQDEFEDSSDCGGEIGTGTGISEVNGIAISPDGDNVYTSGAPNTGSSGSIAEFSVGDGGALTQMASPNNCLGTPESGDPSCGPGTATGVVGITGLLVSPDGTNLYSASQFEGGPIAEFSRDPDSGGLTQLASPNDCIEETGDEFGCGSTGTGIGAGYELAISPDGANVYSPAPSNACDANSCSDVAEFARDSANQGALTQLPSPDSCIQDTGADGSECPGNESATGLGGAGIAISPDGGNVYATGVDSVAEFSRETHKLTVSLTGSGTVSDNTGLIHCTSTCSSGAFTANVPVTLTATPSSGFAFAGWGGACSGTGTCQVPMSADTNVTASFTSTATPPAPGSPTPVVTSAPTAVTDGGAGFSGSVNPDGLPTTAYFQYGLDKKYSQVGASGANYTTQTQAQVVGSDFTNHGVGPVTVTGLVPNALYHVRLVATNSAGTTFGQDVTFTTALAPNPGPPTLGQTFNIEPISGLVLVFIHGHLVPLTQLTQIPSGVPIDTLHGTLKLITATGGGGPAHDASAKTQTGEFSGAVFRLSQQTRGAGKGLVTLMLALSAFKGAPSQATCRSNGAAADAHAASSSKVIQLLHASAHGKFRTSGRYSAATVLGTSWTVAARCDGTLTHDITDSVEVTDFVRHKTIILHAGQSYLAPGPRKHK